MTVAKQEDSVKYDRAVVGNISRQLDDKPSNHAELFSALMQHLGANNKDDPLVELVNRLKSKTKVKKVKKMKSISCFQDQFMGMYD